MSLTQLAVLFDIGKLQRCRKGGCAKHSRLCPAWLPVRDCILQCTIHTQSTLQAHSTGIFPWNVKVRLDDVSVRRWEGGGSMEHTGS